MKGFKKLLTGILAATMVFAMGITAGATDTTTTTNASLTIDSKNDSNQKPDAVITYNYFQVLKADIVSGSQIAYYVTDTALADAVKGTGLFNVKKSADGSRYNVTLIDDKTTGEAIAAALNTDAVKNAVTVKGEFKSANGVAKQELEAGYYLVLSSLGTVAAVQTVGDVTINEKNSYPTIVKADDKDYAEMFETVVTYTLTVNVPASVAQKPITVVDTATLGLTFDSNVVAKVDGVEVGQYKWSAPVLTDGKNVYTTQIPAETVAANASKQIVLTYTAKVNDKAVVLVPEENTAHLVYDNYNSAETEPVDVTTLGFKLIKIDGISEKALTGAEFTLWNALTDGKKIAVVKDGDVYRVAKDGETGVNIVVNEAGEATVVGLDATTYYLQEEKAPAGYNMLSAREPVVINGDLQVANKAVQEIKVKNNTGSVLPSTGGIGTTIFYILGGVLIIAGVAYFMVRRKADAQA